MQWIPVGTDVTGRASALQTNRADATLLTAPNYFRLEEAGFKNLANLADHDGLRGHGLHVRKSAIAANPRLPEQIIKAHAEAIKRFYDDKAFAVKTYIAYDKQPEADVARIYDLYAKGNIFDRVPYVHGGAPSRRSSLSRSIRGWRRTQGLRLQAGHRQRHRRRAWSRKAIFQQLFGAGDQSRRGAQSEGMAFRCKLDARRSPG